MHYQDKLHPSICLVAANGASKACKYGEALMQCRAQAMKLLEFIWFDFLGGLAQKNSKEAASAVSRLTQYLQDQRWLQPPPGRELEMFDASTYDRA